MTDHAELANRVRKLEDAVRHLSSSLLAALDNIESMHREMEMYRNRRPLVVVNSDELATV